MIKIMSIVLTGAIALLAGAYYIAPTQQTSLIANADSLGFLNYYIADDHVEITDCLDMAMGDIVIPDTIGNKPVTSINKESFKGKKYISSVEIPGTVTWIGDNTFQGCTALVYYAYLATEGTDDIETFTVTNAA